MNDNQKIELFKKIYGHKDHYTQIEVLEFMLFLKIMESEE